ncbi:MAG TPA: aldo/keto reductase [Candidatus Saccharimonadales bacterium]|nr:aldo/keto reductase [Candidatus Saccharimonadales bacterium]
MAVTNLKLNNGQQIPQIGLGTWLIKDESECKKAIKVALEAGYRHFDTAQYYANEQFVGVAIKESNIKRQDIFITTKISIDNFLPSRVIPSFEKSLEKLQTDYVDLLLLHFPVTKLRHTAWKKLEEIHRSGRAKSIGVSNYTIRHLKKLLNECEVKPAVNQVEIHVFLQQPKLLDYCKQNDIVVEAYSPLVHGRSMNNETLMAIAKKHNKSTAQIMLRWCVEQDLVVLPKSSNPGRIKENIQIFDFRLDDIDRTTLAQLDDNYHSSWDPTYVP